MQEENFIPANEFCSHYDVELNFVNSLQEFGLIKTVRIEQNEFIPSDQLSDIEKIIRLHYDLNINLEGIDVIYHLLRRLDGAHQEITDLKNRLRVFEAMP